MVGGLNCQGPVGSRGTATIGSCKCDMEVGSHINGPGIGDCRRPIANALPTAAERTPQIEVNHCSEQVDGGQIRRSGGVSGAVGIARLADVDACPDVEVFCWL